MAATTPYRWQGNLYCDTEIVGFLTEIQPWSDWLDAGHTPSADPEADMNSLAEFFGIDRTDPDHVDQRRFPQKARHAAGFCTGCLHWFE